MKKILLTLIFFLSLTSIFAQTDKISIINNNDGAKLLVNGNSFMINGMNWDYFPIGTNYNYSLWKQSDDVIKAALDIEMTLLKNMGVNAIRQYAGVQPKWIQYIYEKYGIYTVLNHTFGRYGLTLDGVWAANTDYSDPRVHKILLKEVKQMVENYKNVPGVLMYMLGNENDYGLFWEGAETENIPMEDRKSTHKALALYQLFEEAFVEIKKIDSSHPTAMCNGEVLFIDIIAKECPDMDIFSINCYRGKSFGDIFEKVKKVLNKPMFFSEFGSDAYNSIENAEDQKDQAEYDLNNWKEIYQNAAGMGKAGNSLGGFTFQFCDGWWKYKQTADLEVHNTNASWSNGGYQFDFKSGVNNMNEEWFGICAKGATTERGIYQLYPRAAYYALKEAYKFNPYANGATPKKLESHFAAINIAGAVLQARGDAASLNSEGSKTISVGLRAEITTFNTGGNLITTGNNNLIVDPSKTSYPDKLGFDHMESYYLNVDVKPSGNVHANVSVNILGNVAGNPIDEVFYENRGRSNPVTVNGTTYDLSGAERVKVYSAKFDWDDKWFTLAGFYRTGHYHWGYDGDFFGLYREANYGPNMDIYQGNAPFGFEVNCKKELNGLTLAFGPELWWGANPAVMAKYYREILGFTTSLMYQEDIDQLKSTTSSNVLPTPKTRKTTFYVKRKFGPVGIELGGIWAGSPLVGRSFQLVDVENSKVYADNINLKDTWGGKGKITLQVGPLNWYAQGAAMGLVAEAGPDATKTFTGWRLKDSGSGNQYNFLSGLAYSIGDLQIAPNFLWQKPIIGPIPTGIVDKDTKLTATPRNILNDPFVVRANRETVAGELLLTYDPTPATWMYEWDNDMAEDAPFACNVDFVYRHLPTTMDATIGFMADRTRFVFNGAPAAHDLWETNIHIVSKLTSEFGLIANLLTGNGQANGTDARIIQRYSGDLTMIYKKIKLLGSCKVNDWGPYDYHRDYNITYPLQLVADLSTSASKATWFILPDTRLGIRATWRALDQYSSRYCPTTSIDNSGKVVANPYAKGYGYGNEWEIRTYVHFNIGK